MRFSAIAMRCSIFAVSSVASPVDTSSLTTDVEKQIVRSYGPYDRSEKRF